MYSQEVSTTFTVVLTVKGVLTYWEYIAVLTVKVVLTSWE
jgi:hypothetical protein